MASKQRSCTVETLPVPTPADAQAFELLKRVPAMIHSIDNTGRLKMVTDEWLTKLGYERSEVLGRPSTDFLTDASRNHARRVLQDFFDTGECRDVAYEFVCKDGKILDIMLSATSMHCENGEFVGSIAVLRDVSAERRAHALACVDDLTGLLRRREFEQRLRSLLSDPQREGCVVVGFIDVDRFKTVNDRLGHVVGDNALMAIADVLRGALRSTDLMCRIGGDEFAFAAQVAPDRQEDVAGRVRTALESVAFTGSNDPVSATVGYVSVDTSERPTVADVLVRADAAMYSAKPQPRADRISLVPDASRTGPQLHR